jgi:hypothetical protein
MRPHGPGLRGGIRSVSALVEILDHLHLLGTRDLQITKDVLDEDDRRVDDDAEVYRSERQQIRIFSAQHQQNDREEKCEGYVHSNDNGASQIAQKDPLDQENQEAAQDQVVQHGMGSDGDQRHTVVERHDFHIRRKSAVVIHRVDLAIDARYHIGGVRGAPHYDYRHGHIIIPVLAHDAEPRHVSDVAFGHVFHEYWGPVGLRQHDIFDVRYIHAASKVVSAAVVDQPNPANIRRLLAKRDFAATDINVCVCQGCGKLS